jgi:hypothetical protein
MMVDPYDPRSIAEAFTALDGDAKLRGRLAKAGPVQAARFSAAAYRGRLAGLYARLGVTF